MSFGDDFITGDDLPAWKKDLYRCAKLTNTTYEFWYDYGQCIDTSIYLGLGDEQHRLKQIKCDFLQSQCIESTRRILAKQMEDIIVDYKKRFKYI